VTEAQFPPRTVRDLIEICAPASEDPKMTAAINYCHGFAQGAVASKRRMGTIAMYASCSACPRRGQPAAPK